jgi:hypothetical protein
LRAAGHSAPPPCGLLHYRLHVFEMVRTDETCSVGLLEVPVVPTELD